jgi:VWFA-related protein
MKFEKILMSLSAVLLCALAAAAQKPTPTPAVAEEDQVIKVNSRLIVVPVSVTDANGEPVLGLKAENFRIREEGRQQTVDSVGNAETVPLEIAVLFDVSASTNAMFKHQQETAAKFLNDVMRPDDRATIFTVGVSGKLVQSRETAERSIAAIGTIIPMREQTAFYDAVRMAANHLERNTPEGRRKVMLVISDGDDTNSDAISKAMLDAERKVSENVQGEQLRDLRIKARDTAKATEQVRVMRSLQNADTVFYAINTAGSSVHLNKMAAFGQENLQKFADDTGGTSFLPTFQPIETPDALQNSVNVRKNTEMLERIFRQIASELRAQYLVQYYSESEFPQNKFVKLEVGLTSAPAKARVRARQGYYVKN